MAGVALGDIDLHFVWQARHLAGSGGALGSRCLRIGVAVCVAGVALGDIQFHVAWQAWHLVTLTCTLSGRRGTWWHRPSLCVAGVALGDIDLHFVCVRPGTYGTGLALVARLGPVVAVVAAAVCVAGVALGDI